MHPRFLSTALGFLVVAAAPAARSSEPIVLQPQPGAMQVTARVPALDNQAFALGIPETIGCREAMLVNFPEAKIDWQGPDEHGVVSCSWGPGGRIAYTLRLVPADDHVDVEMTIRNHTEFLWRDVFAFNCINPIQARTFHDWKLQRTYMSRDRKPFRMSETTRMQGHMPTVGFYLPEHVRAGEESLFVRGFGATSSDRTDGSWIVTISDPAGSYMAATAMEAAFLFDNLDRCCIHAAPSFGDIGPGEASTTVSRFYLARGTLDDFLRRMETDRVPLMARQKWARPAQSSETAKPRGRMELMTPDELERVLAEAPVAFVPVGTFEHHGWHLPVCFDGIKAHALCERVAERTGGTVLPAFFYGTGGGHIGYKWTLMLPEAQVAPLIEATLDHLARQGFKVVVLLTGHYPQEQVNMVHRLTRETQKRHPKVRFIGLTEPEVTTPEPGDAYGGDHAAKYETSIALALNSDWVQLDRLTPDRAPEQVTLSDTPRRDASTHDPTHPLYAIHGQDPRERASKELGEKLVNEIVARLADKVIEALGQVAKPSAGVPRVFRVADFGAGTDGKTEAGDGIRAAIASAIASGQPAEVFLDAGTYRVRPEAPRQACFPIHQATNLTIRGAGKSTRIVIADPASGGFGFGLCQQVSVRDLVLDYDPVPFCQGTVREVDSQSGSFDLEVEAGYPTPDAENFLQAVEPYGKWGMIMDRAARRIRAGTPDHFMTPRWEHREGRVWRFFTADEHHRRNLAHMQVGDAYVHLARGHGSAVFAQGCDGVRIENLTVHASPGLAVGLVGNRGEVLVRGLEVRFAPNTARLLTTNADGVHGQQNRSGPVIEDCYFEGMADDAINLYAPPNVLREVRSHTQWLVSPGALILPGDRLQVLDPRTSLVRGEVKVTGGKVEQRAFLIDLDRPIEGVVAGTDHCTADTLYNLDACGAGFLIRRNHMNGNRRYGCLLRAGDGVVEDNLFEDTTGAGVVLANEPDWPEGPVPWGITIRGNRFLRGGTCLGYADSPHGGALAVRPVRLGHGLAEAQSVRDLIIENNDFLDRAGAAIYVGGATNVMVQDNRITASATADRRRPGPSILIENSSGVTLQNNIVSDPRPGTTAALEIAPSVASGDLGVRISELKASLVPEARPVHDRRASLSPPR